MVVGVEHIHVGVGREVRCERHAEQAPVPEVVHVSVEVGEDVGVVSLSESNTLITPRFSATKTRPSLLNRTTVGLTRPLKTVDSVNPAGRVAASADREVATTETPVDHDQQHAEDHAVDSAVSV